MTAPGSRERPASCAVVLVPPSGMDGVGALLDELAASEAWHAEESAVIVWPVGADEGEACGGEGGPRGDDSNARAERSLARPPMLRELRDGAALERGSIYLVQQQHRVWFEASTARVAPRSPADDPPLDGLLRTLAEAWGEHGVAVVALALEDDGQRGMALVRAAGGVTWYRPPQAGRATRAPSSTSPLEHELPRGLESPRSPAAPAGSEPAPAERISRVLALPPQLLARLRTGCRFAAQLRGGRVRVWVPGCKTGGVAYLVAMLLLEASDPSTPPLLSVHGTDIDESRIATARSGRYPARSALGMDPELRGRYTLDEADTIRVSEKVRRLCRFFRHDLFRDPPLAQMDLVVCHGLVDSTPPSSLPELGEVLHYAVRHGGLVIALDHLDVQGQRFEPVAQGLWKARPAPAGPALHRRLTGPAARADELRLPAATTAGTTEAVLQAIALPLILCDDRLCISFISAEARAVLRLNLRHVGVPLAAVRDRLPAGTELLESAKQALLEGRSEALTIRAADRTYLARISPTSSGARGVSLVFTDVTALSQARAVAMAQRLQQAALARVSEVALSGASLSDICDEALGALFGNIPPCAAGLVVELAGPLREPRVLASRGLPNDPLRGAASGAGPLVNAVIERGSMVASEGEHAAVGAPTSPSSAPSPASEEAAPVLAAVGCPITAGDEMLGVLALLGRPAIAHGDHRHFVQSVANVLGGAVHRQRTRRRIELELEVGRALSGASRIAQLHEGLHRALADTLLASRVELWARDDETPRRWSRLCPVEPDDPTSPPRSGEQLRTPWPSELMPPSQAEVVAHRSADGDELLVPIVKKGQVSHVLRLGGEQLLSPDRELVEGLHGVARLLGEFLERMGVLDSARRREAAHRQKSAELEALYASLPVGVSTHDRAGAIRRTNSQLASLEAPDGTPGAEPLKRLYSDQLPPWIARVVAMGEDVRDIELGVEHGGTHWVWLCNLAPIRDLTGEVQGVSVAVQNITPLKRIETALREADQQKDDFLAILGHELRNPMAAIRNATELLARFAPGSPPIARLHGIFDRQTQHTTRLIDGLLDVARVARGKIELSLAPVALVQVVRQVVDDRRQKFEDRVLDLQLPADELWVRADRVRLVQIIDNLLSNAVKFTRSGGRIGVELSSRHGVTLVIEDDGAGIEPELLPRIFEPFHQGSATRALSQGLGLGLALVKGLADLHGFRLQASSPGVGRGARFEIDMPLSAPPDSIAPESRVDSRPLDLVLVEDDDDVAETLGELLQGLGHRVVRFASAEDALLGLGSHRPDVVLCDIGLPGMDGLELAARLRADPASRDLPLVAMTGFGDASTRARIEDAGFNRRLIKPVQIAALEQCLSRIAALPQQAVKR